MKIVDRVNAEGARARRLVMFTACAAGIAGAVALLTLGAVILGGGRWLTLPSWIPFAWWAVATGLIAYAAWRLPRRVASTVTNEAMARATETERGLRAGSLVGLVQLSSMGGSLVQLQENYVGGLLGSGTLAPEQGKKHAFAALGAVGTVVVAAVITWASTASGADGWRALMHPVAAANGSLLPPISLVNTPISILRGDSLMARVQATGRRYVTLSWRVTGSGWQDSLLRVTDGEAMLPLGTIDAPVVVIATDGRSTTDSLNISVYERPFAGDVALRAVYPGYLGRPAEALGADDLLRLPEGTTIEITARSAGLQNVALAGERDTIPMQLLAGRAVGRMTASVSGSWKWISATTGADLPPAIEFDVIPDSAPRIDIISPTGDTTVTPGDTVRLLVAATDDYGLNSVRLRMWNQRGDGAKDGERATSLSQVAGERFLGELDLDLGISNLKPGDALIIIAEARDAAPWQRVGESRRLELRVPTADERRAAAMSAADSAVAAANAAAAEQKALEKRTSDAAKTSSKAEDGKSDAASFDQQERARQLVADQKAMGERLEEMAKQAEQLQKELQKAGVMDSSMSSELREAQRLLREAMTPEMQKQLAELEAQRGKMSADELQDAIAKLQNPQQDMREALEKAKEMLNRAALEGRMQSASDQAKDLARDQKAFADSMKAQNGRGDTSSATAKEQSAEAKELADRTKAFEKELQNLADRLNKDQANAAKQGVDSAGKQAAEASKQMQEAQKNAEQNGQQKAGQQGNQQGGQQSGQQQGGQQGQNQNGQQNKDAAQQAADAMQKASDQLGQAKQSQVNQWKQELTEALDRSIQETQQMANQQEQLGNQARQGNGQQLRGQQGALQQGVEQTAQRMDAQAQKSALVSPNSQRAMEAARKAVDNATRELNEGASGQQAQRAMQDAADALRQAAASMSRDRERAGSSQSASGLPEMMQQMREMAAQQAQLNATAAQILPQAQQLGQGTPQQKEAVKPVAERQRELAQKLEDAADADPTKRAEALAREAREIARQLERGELDRTVIDRQSQLFKRMLDAGRTLEQNERDESGKREAKSGEGIRSDAPATGASRGDPAVKFREPTWKELTGMSAEDRRLVAEYFRRLNEKKQ